MNPIKDNAGIPIMSFQKVDTFLGHIHLDVMDVNNRKQVCHHLAQFLQLTTEFGHSITERLMDKANTQDEGETVQLIMLNQDKTILQSCFKDINHMNLQPK